MGNHDFAVEVLKLISYTEFQADVKDVKVRVSPGGNFLAQSASLIRFKRMSMSHWVSLSDKARLGRENWR